MTNTAKDIQLNIVPPLDLINFNSKPRSVLRQATYKRLKLSEVKLHVKAYPYKHLDNDCVASKRLYLFDSIRINDKTGKMILEHNLPELIELNENYSIKLSDILHDDMVVNGLDITLSRNDRPFEVTELYLQYVELPVTDEKPLKIPFYKTFSKVYNVIPNEYGQEYHLYLCENYNLSNSLPEFKYQRITEENGIYCISNYNYENDIDWILIDNKEEINKNIKKLEEYIGHELLVKIKPTSNVLLLSEIKYNR